MKMTRGFGYAMTIVVAAGAVVWLFGVAVDAQTTSTSVARATSAPTSRPTTAPAVSAERVAALIAQLGDDSAATRQQASRELTQVGEPAIPALRQAATSRDPEVAALASGLVKTILQANAGILRAQADTYLRWKAELPAGYNRNLAFAGNVAVFHNFQDGKGKLHAISLADGKGKWEFAVGHIASPPFVRQSAPPSATLSKPFGDMLLVYEHAGEAVSPKDYKSQLIALSSATGKVLWRRDIDTSFVVYTDGNHLVFSQEHEGTKRIGLLSPRDGTTVWEEDISDMVRKTGENSWALPNCYVTKGIFLVWRHDEKQGTSLLVAWDPATGERLWEKTVDGFGGTLLLAANEDSPNVPIFLRSKGGELTFTAYDPRSGKEAAPIEMPLEAAKGGLWRMGSGRMLRTQSIGMMAFDTTSGKRVWQYTPRKSEDDYAKRDALLQSLKGQYLWDLPLREVHGDMVLLNVHDGLLSLDLQTGKPLWKYPTAGLAICTLDVREGVAYFVAYDVTESGDPNVAKSYLHALDLSKARQLGVPEGETVERNE